jgi:hypothetical protein
MFEIVVYESAEEELATAVFYELRELVAFGTELAIHENCHRR